MGSSATTSPASWASSTSPPVAAGRRCAAPHGGRACRDPVWGRDLDELDHRVVGRALSSRSRASVRVWCRARRGLEQPPAGRTARWVQSTPAPMGAAPHGGCSRLRRSRAAPHGGRACRDHVWGRDLDELDHRVVGRALHRSRASVASGAAPAAGWSSRLRAAPHGGCSRLQCRRAAPHGGRARRDPVWGRDFDELDHRVVGRALSSRSEPPCASGVPRPPRAGAAACGPHRTVVELVETTFGVVIGDRRGSGRCRTLLVQLSVWQWTRAPRLVWR